MESPPPLLIALQTIGLELDADSLAPLGPIDATRLDAAWLKFRDEVANELERSTELAAHDGIVENVAMVATELATLLEASGDRLGASEARRLARRWARSEAARREVEASEADLAGYRALLAARAEHRRERFREGDAILKKIQTTAPALRTLIDAALDGLRPLEGAPSMFTFNSVGTMLYGARDRWPDGTYVATLCAVVAFMPVFPIAAYRVFEHGDSKYSFYAKVRLSPFARLAQVGVLASMVLGLTGFFAHAWWSSPGRRAAEAIAEAEALQGPARIARYDAILDEYGYEAPGAVTPAALAVIDATIAGVAEPMTARRVDEAERVVLRLQSLPAGRDAATVRVKEALVRWREQVGTDSLDAAEASARLAAAVARVVPSDLEAERAAMDAAVAVADQLREEWPLAALLRYVDHLSAPGVADRIGELVTQIEALDDDATWCAVDLPIQTWLRMHAGDRRAAIDTKLEGARLRCTNASRMEVLTSGDVEALRAALTEAPNDRVLAAALADHLRFEGRIDEARALFGDLRPGWLVPEALVSYAAVLRDLGELDEAARLLDRHVRDRLGRYQTAIQHHDTLAEQIYSDLATKAERGGDPALRARLNGVHDEEEMLQVFQEYAREQIANNPRLTAMRDQLEQYSDVVPASLALGTLQLQRAEARDGEGRAELLQEAERVFLAIRQEAEGAPEFHVGLGQVYHRLGRRAEGDAELEAVAADSPALRLHVAEVYRELSLVGPSRANAERAYADGDETVKGRAAIVLSQLATNLEDEETWLSRAPAELAFVRLQLQHVRAERALEARRWDEAATGFREVARGYEADAASGAAAANNAALAWARVHGVTGEPAALDRAVELLEQSARREPDSAIVVSNLASIHEHRGLVRVVAGRLRVRELRLDVVGTERLVDAMLEGPDRTNVLEELRRDPSHRRATELWRQAAVLAPTMSRAHDAESTRARRFGERDAELRVYARLRELDFADAESRERYEAHARGDEDERTRREIDTQVAQAHTVLTETQAGGDAATIAAAHLLFADALLQLAALTSDPNDAARAVASLRAASAQGLFGAALEARALFLEAVLRAAREDPALGARWEARRRVVSAPMWVAELRAEPASLALLQARADLRTSADALATRSGEPDLVLWAVGEALTHVALTNANLPARTDPLVRARLEADAHVGPWREDVRVKLSWL